MSNQDAFAAMKSDGSISAWGRSGYGDTGEPTDNDYVSINGVTQACFQALYAPAANTAPTITSAATASFVGNSTGTVIDVQSTDDSDSEGAGLVYTLTGSGADNAAFSIDANGLVTFNTTPDFASPVDAGNNNVYDIEIQVCDSEPLCTTHSIAITVTDPNAALVCSGVDVNTAYNQPGGYFANSVPPNRSFAALNADGTISAWGNATFGGSGAPTDNGYTSITGNVNGYSAMKADGSITYWGSTPASNTAPPTDNGYTSIVSSTNAFAA